MKRIMVVKYAEFESDKRNISLFETKMYHGEYGTENKNLVLYKNIDLLSPLFMPSSWYVVQDKYVERFNKLPYIEIVKEVSRTFSIKISEYEKFGKEYKKFNEFEKSIFYDKFVKFINTEYEFYKIRLPICSSPLVRINDKKWVEINEFGKVAIDNNQLSVICEYPVFSYLSHSFFQPEIFELILPLIDQKYFSIKEVDIPVR